MLQAMAVAYGSGAVSAGFRCVDASAVDADPWSFTSHTQPHGIQRWWLPHTHTHTHIYMTGHREREVGSQKKKKNQKNLGYKKKKKKKTRKGTKKKTKWYDDCGMGLLYSKSKRISEVTVSHYRVRVSISGPDPFILPSYTISKRMRGSSLPCPWSRSAGRCAHEILAGRSPSARQPHTASCLERSGPADLTQGGTSDADGIQTDQTRIARQPVATEERLSACPTDRQTGGGCESVPNAFVTVLVTDLHHDAPGDLMPVHQ